MPPSMALIHKGPTLDVIDTFVRNASDTEMQDILTELDALDPVNPDIVGYARGHPPFNFVEEQLKHLEDHWFNTSKSSSAAYWPTLQFVEAIFFAGLRKAIELSVKDSWGANRTPHLPLDSYWLVLGSEFKVAVMLNDNQRVTMLLITPVPASAIAPSTGPENIWLAQAGPSGAQIGQIPGP